MANLSLIPSVEAGARPSDPVRIAVVIPCYRVKRHVLSVIEKIGPEVFRIYAVDDKCPEQSGAHILETCTDPRIHVLFNAENTGVGGAVMAGYRHAVADGAAIVVKIDGDGQMDPTLLPLFVTPILNGLADYTKGNRFFHLDGISRMPKVRLFGNAVLSFMTKFSSGYWDVFDPTNGYTAISAPVIANLPLDKISQRYFFESDMLFRLNTVQARVVDIPMQAIYEDEESNLHIRRVLFNFLTGNIRNTIKRIGYNYFLRNFSIASCELILGLGLLAFGLLFGLSQWWLSNISGVGASSGTVMLAGLPVIVGIQFLLAFVNYDIAAVPRHPIHPFLNLQAATLAAIRRWQAEQAREEEGRTRQA